MSEAGFSFGKLAVFSLGSAVAVLGVATVVIAVVQPGPGLGLVIALLGVIGAIGAMGLVSTRMTRVLRSDRPESDSED